jgi:hypothetical protein
LTTTKAAKHQAAAINRILSSVGKQTPPALLTVNILEDAFSMSKTLREESLQDIITAGIKSFEMRF